MAQNQHNIILTGATGNVGVHILYELLIERLEGKVEGVIVLLVRANMKMSGYERVALHLGHDSIPYYLQSYSLKQMLSFIHVIECNYHHKSVTSLLAEYDHLNNVTVIHSAATTNLSSGEASYNENIELNFLGTINFYNAVKLFASRFVYISTAYACGARAGIIHDRYSEMDNLRFRNPYEEVKHRTEKELTALTLSDDISLQILRPGVVVGRLSDAPLYFLPKYNVIYAFAAFFYSLVNKNIQSHIDIAIGEETHLHLIPVDYVAKVVARVYTDHSVKELNIIPAVGSCKDKIAEILNVVGYSEFTFTKEYQAPKSKMEKVFQSRVADSFGQYIKGAYYEFDNSQLLSLTEGIPLPDVNQYFKALITYAKDQEFSRVE